VVRFQVVTHIATYPVRLGDRGRLVLPAELRRRAGLREGQELVLVYAGGVIRLASREELARVGRGMFAGAAPGRDLVTELLEERRAEARTEGAASEPHPARGSQPRPPRST
jgi:AbrB family looped-hinge helix DNA binding protein